MKRLLSIAMSALACGGLAAEVAVAKGLDMAAPDGVALPGSAYRYVAVSPGIPQAITFVARVERRSGRLSRWWYLRGNFQVPAVDFDRTAGGLSADGGTLVLSRSYRGRHAYPPRTTRFAVLHPHRSARWRGPGRPPRFRQLATFVDLPGHYSFDAISPDGSTLYLIEHLSPRDLTRYRVRAYDLEAMRLIPAPIVDPVEPDERMAGLPISRATSPDGRWAYTLYEGREPFLHALDTVGRRAVCVDLPQLHRPGWNVSEMRLRMGGGEALTVVGRRSRGPELSPLLTVDADSFEVAQPPTEAGGAGSGPPWLPIGLLSIALAAGLVWVARRPLAGEEGGRA